MRDSNRRTRHGAHCPKCDSVNVVIDNTRSRVHSASAAGERVLHRRQYCRCTACNWRWTRLLRLSEEVIRGDM